MKYFLSLGSNLGNKRKNIDRAICLLQEGPFRILRASSLYETQPVGQADQPWFINQVLKIETDLTPWQLFVFLQALEQKMGRTRTKRNGPRVIDLDILLAEDTVIKTPCLIIPHPRMVTRNFVLVPLRQIAPRAIHPVLKKSIADLLEECGDPSAVQKVRSRSRRRGRA